MAVNAKQKAYNYIKSLLIENVANNDFTLSETAIAEAVGVSRTPVREAMSLLESEGWIEIIPNKGPVRVSLDVNDVIMITQILEGLEGIAARIACERASRDEIQKLRQGLLVLDDLNNPEQQKASQKIGYAVHSLIVQSTGNKRLIKIVENLLYQRRAIGSLGVYNEANTVKRYEQHLAILDALLKKDPDHAEAVMRNHVVSVSMDALDNLYKGYLRY